MVVYISSSPPAWTGADDEFPEGNLGAQFGDIVVSTPNAQVMYAPLCDGPRSLVLREGNHFGQDDAMVHPQLYDAKSNQLACIPTPTKVGEFAILFIRLEKHQHWESVSFNGLGKIKSYTARRLIGHGERVLQQMEKLVADAQAGLHPTISRTLLPNAKSKRIQWYLKSLLRLLETPASFEDCAMRWANTQRMQLDAHSFIDYLTIFRPLLLDPPLLPRPVDNSRAGCITTNLMTATELHAVGIPVWYVYKARACTRTKFRRFMTQSEVDRLLRASSIPPRPIQMGQVEDRNFISLRHPPDFVTIWSGSADDSERFAAMAEVFRGDRLPTVPRPSVPQPASSSSMLPPPPPPASTASTSSTLPATPSSSTSGAETSAKRGRQDSVSEARPEPKSRKTSKSAHASSSRSRTSSARPDAATSSAPRSRWFEPSSPTDILPRGIPTAVAALEAVRVELQPKQNEFPEQIRLHLPGQEGHHSLFAAPDGGQVAGLSRIETQAGALANYVRFRPIIQWRLRQLVAAPASTPKNLRAQDWRSLLGVSVFTEKPLEENEGKQTKASKNRESLVKILEENMQESGSNISFSLDRLDENSLSWLGGTEVEGNRLPSTLVCRQIIWEMYEMNFRAEFIILDHFMYNWNSQLFLEPDDRGTPSSRRAEIVTAMGYWDWDIAPGDKHYTKMAEGLAAVRRQDRVSSVVQFWTLMGSWVGVGGIPEEQKESVLRRLADLLNRVQTFELKDLFDVEEICWKHYIRTFYRVFGRPPTLPRAIPSQGWESLELS